MFTVFVSPSERFDNFDGRQSWPEQFRHEGAGHKISDERANAGNTDDLADVLGYHHRSAAHVPCNVKRVPPMPASAPIKTPG